MIEGIYSGANALENYSRQQDVVASNLAHLNTPGYRRQLFSLRHDQGQEGAEYPQDNVASIGSLATSFVQGPKESTGRQLDVAINGDGFFVYQGAEENLYSRSGVLFRDPEGKLVNGDGLAVLDQGQPIIIPPEVSDYDLIIDSEGGIHANGEDLGKLSIVSFDDNQKLGSTSQIYFTAGDAVVGESENAMVLQGHRELSNSHPVSELISLIVGSRGFEAAQRVIRTISDSVQEGIRDI